MEKVKFDNPEQVLNTLEEEGYLIAKWDEDGLVFYETVIDNEAEAREQCEQAVKEQGATFMYFECRAIAHIEGVKWSDE